MNSTDATALTEMRARAKTSPDAMPTVENIAGWSVRLSRSNIPGLGVRWALSAQLYPKGRSSAVEDWRTLGQIVQTLGAPEKPAIPIEETDPNGSHEWRWVE